MNNDLLQRYAGLVTWAIVTAIVIYLSLQNGGSYAEKLPFVVAFAVLNLASILVATSETVDILWSRLAFWLQLISAFAMAMFVPISFMPIYTIIWIAMATHFYSIRTCWLLMPLVAVCWFLIMHFVWQSSGAFITTTLYMTFHLFALMTASNAAAAVSARAEVEALNRELQATQHLLAEASRFGERTRIARNLHDLLGHHLTALSINLQIAERLTSGEAKSKVEESRALARLLLSDVREAVSQLRAEGAINFSKAVTLLIDRTPGLNIVVDIEEGLSIGDVAIAETLLRIVQESITNTLRHANAKNCWVKIRKAEKVISLDFRDDGRLLNPIVEGKGLIGMRERLAEIEGTLHLSTLDGALRLHAEIPDGT